MGRSESMSGPALPVSPSGGAISARRSASVPAGAIDLVDGDLRRPSLAAIPPGAQSDLASVLPAGMEWARLRRGAPPACG